MATKQQQVVHLVQPLNLPEARAALTEEHKLEIANLKIVHLKTEIRRLETLIYYKDQALEDAHAELMAVLDNGAPMSIGGFKRFLSRLKGARHKFESGAH